MKTTKRAILYATGGAIPTEFRLFKFGANQTTKGTFTLTPESAAACLTTYRAQGVDLIVDLEHDSLSTEARNMRSDAGDARGWFKLELRADGLWAIDVRWTPDGERRLREKTQRYISPAFEHDDDGVVMAIANAAMCSMPATYNAPALVAASRTAMVGVRVATATLARVRAVALRRNTSVSDLLRKALSTVANSDTYGPTPEQIAALKALLDALGLEPGAGAAVIVNAVSDLLQALEPADHTTGDGTPGASDPTGQIKMLQVLSAPAVRASLARITDPQQRSKFLEARAKSRLQFRPDDSEAKLIASLSARDRAVLARITDPKKRSLFIATRSGSRLR